MSTNTQLALIAATLLTLSARSDAAIIRLDNTAGQLGALLDGQTSGTFNVPTLSPLTISIQNFGPDGSLNSTATGFGINSQSGTDDTDAFDAGESEFVTFQFSEDVIVTQLDFTTFDSGDVFDFAGTTINNSDLSNGTTDVFDFSTPLTILANTDFSFQATTGTIGIEAFDISLASAAVPEPSFFVVISLGLGLSCWRRRIANAKRAGDTLTLLGQ